jgi:hypothetical protein
VTRSYGQEVFTSPEGTRYVRAGVTDPVDFTHQTRLTGVLKLTRIEHSVAIFRAVTREKKAERIARKRAER